jgi:ParB-like nuclease domain
MVRRLEQVPSDDPDQPSGTSTNLPGSPSKLMPTDDEIYEVDEPQIEDFDEGVIASASEVSLVCLCLDSLNSAPQNSQIYRPVVADDPEIQALARSIKKHGLREPLVVTTDRYIVSGHRRYMACRLAGLEFVDCRELDISSDDPGFEALLCEYNRQRVKSLDEVVREEVVCRDPDNAYASLIKSRKAQSAVTGEFLRIEGTKTRKAISAAKMPMLEAIEQIIDEQRDYWPLSDRSIHYGLLNVTPLRHASKPDSKYKNSRLCYQDLCDLLTRARLSGAIPFDAIGDPTRTICSWALDRGVGGFIGRELRRFLKNYSRDLQQSQPNHIEIVGEKNTIESSIRNVAMEYCIPYTLGRGYCSLDPRHQMFKRFEASGRGKLIILILADFDPEGEDIANSFARSMRDDFGIEDVVAQKVCLTYEQVLERKIPQTFDIKKSSSRYKKFASKYGDRAHELEALPPAERSRLLTEAINGVLDIGRYNDELAAEEEDAKKLAAISKRAADALAGALT